MSVIIVFICSSLSIPTFASTTSPSFAGYSEIGTPKEKFGEFNFKINWQPKTGFTLMLADKNKKSQCFIRLKQEDDKVWIQGDKASANTNLLIERLNPLPEKPVKNLQCVLKLQHHAWSLYLDNKESYRFRAPFKADSLWFQNTIMGLYKKKLRYQKTARLYFHDDFLVDHKDENQLDSWEIMNGKWHIHTALDAAIEQHTSNRLKSRPLQPERSANFYSLKGQGEPGLIVAGYPFHDNYLVQTAIQLQEGESGLVFYVQDKTDFYSFTILLTPNKEAYALLKKHSKDNKIKTLKAVKLSLLPDQWIMPKVQVMGSHVEAFIDNVKVLEYSGNLPPGGQFGLYVNSSKNMRFDDVTAESLPYLELDNMAEVKFHTLATEGDVFVKPRFMSWLLGKSKAKKMFPGKAKQDRWVIYGNQEDKTAVTGVTFQLAPKTSEVGLIFGWQNNKRPFYRLLYTQGGKNPTLMLEQLKNKMTQSKILETHQLPGKKFHDQVSLKAELALNGQMKLFCNNQLVSLRKDITPPQGASGIFIAKRTQATIDKITYRFKPEKRWRDQREKNSNFSTDPFMRHWSSLAGEWLQDPKDKQTMWHKSDFFGPFELTVPIANNTAIHLGAKDGNPKGEITISNKNNNFEIIDETSAKILFKTSSSTLFKKDKNKRPETTYQLKVNERWLWGEYDFRIIFKVKLKQPLSGTRITISGFTQTHLGILQATRDNVKDFLFSQAPHDWFRNGGTWQVINRFQCDPRWSHMNGQSANDLASFWSKYQIEGDFCIEMYAGIRHGDWYKRVGDLNLTVMNQQDTPSQGYTFICSGWDPDHSQKISRMFRNGQLVATSDKYLTPRKRDGNIRKYFNPLINRGRDVHGAWYYIKARRIGNIVEYYFDNEKIFSYEDKNPLPKGGIGIWTFMNSMMVARVKVAAEKIRPKPFSFSITDAAKISKGPVTNPQKVQVLLNKLPANLMTAQSWQAGESAGDPKLTFLNNRTFEVENLLGSGQFGGEGKDLIFPEASISGWTCQLKRTKDAKFNFHFELGWQSSQGKYQTLKRYFCQISGTDYSRGIFQIVGKTPPITPVKINQFNNSKSWTRVWFPVPNVNKFRSSKNLVWKITGFGNFQPSDIVQGLDGNSPGTAYAVKDFTPVFYQAPTVSVNNQGKEKLQYQLQLQGKKIKTENLQNFNKELKGLSLPGMISGKFSIPGKTPAIEMFWTLPENENKWLCKWDKDKYNSIIITTNAHYRYLHNDPLRVKVQDVELPIEELGVNKFRVSLAENTDDKFKQKIDNDLLNIEVIKGDKSRKFLLKWQDCPSVAPPILSKLDGITPFFQSFENEEMRNRTHFSSERMQYHWNKDRQNISLKIANKGLQRLNIGFRADLSTAKYPILQFLYKTGPMGQISLRLKDKIYANLGEPHLVAKTVRYGENIKKDNQWHSWTGLVPDAYDRSSFNTNIFNIYSINFGSFAKEDQTGFNTQLLIDDITFGPAINSADKLAFTPYYFSKDKDISVQMSVVQGEKPFFAMTDAERKKISWKKISNQTKHVPDLSKIKEGINQLMLQAVDSKGRKSQVTSVPFIYDKTPTPAKFNFCSTNDSAYNGTYLQVKLENKGGAPLNPEGIKTAFAGKELKIDKRFTKFAKQTDFEGIEFNWPYLLRNYLNRMKNGESEDFVVSGIVDGAGNKSPDLHIPIKIDYSKDKHPPTFLKPSLPSNICFRLNIDWDPKTPLPFKMKHIISKPICDKTGNYFKLSSQHDRAYINFIDRKRKYNPEVSADSNLLMRIRYPKKDFPSGATLNLNILFSNNRRISLNLLDGQILGAGKFSDFHNPKNKQWQNIIIDLNKLYQERFKNKKRYNSLKNATIRSLMLDARNLKNREIFDLNMFTIFRKLSPNDKITLNGYDQSGLAGLSWTLTNANGKEVQNGNISGQEMAMKELKGNGKIQMLKIALKDKAGNQTQPMMFPIILDPPPPPPPPPSPKPKPLKKTVDKDKQEVIKQHKPEPNKEIKKKKD